MKRKNQVSRDWRNRQSKATPTAEEIRSIFHYDPVTGLFTYRVSRGPRKAGDVSGTLSKDGRTVLNYLGQLYQAHRVAWVYMTGEWPKFEIDHRDSKPLNNAWSNLRDVTSTVNKQNMREAPKSKKYSPLLGAQWCAQIGRWKSSIRASGKLRHLGTFDTDVEASEAYLKAKRSLHEGCTI